MLVQPMHMNGHPAAAQAGYVNDHAAHHHHHHHHQHHQQQNGMLIDHNVWQQILAPVQQQIQLTAQDYPAIRRVGTTKTFKFKFMIFPHFSSWRWAFREICASKVGGGVDSWNFNCLIFKFPSFSAYIVSDRNEVGN